jgi:hypothetical protein
MPRGTLTQGRSRFHQIHGQARRLLRTLTREIRIKEAELQSLRHDEAKLAAATGQRNAPFSRMLMKGSNRETGVV